MNVLTCQLTVAALIATASLAQARKWTSASGSTLEAELASLSKTHAVLDAEGARRKLALSAFSAKDQTYLRRLYRERKLEQQAQKLEASMDQTLSELDEARAQESAEADSMIKQARSEEAEKEQRKAERARKKRATTCGGCPLSR